MARLAITLACGDYDRTRALADGRAGVEGADLTVLTLSPEEIFFRMVRFGEFDVAELSLSTYVLTAQQDAPFAAIPALPEGVEVTGCPEGRTLSEMLVAGEIDALYTPRVPRPFLEGDPRVRRLFPDVRAAEESYYRRTRIFPIMHVVAIRREVYERSRWLASSLVKAFAHARDLAFSGLGETAALPYVLPWVYEEIGRVQALMGDNYWSYGLNPANRKVLSTFLRYAREQGLAQDGTGPEDLFARETREELAI